MEWKKIEGYDHYEISNDGQVRTHAKNKNSVMKQHIWGDYLAVHLSSHGEGKFKTIHRLLAIHFIPNPERYDFVDHINRNKLDNRLENLRWCSRSQNKYNTPVVKSSSSGYKYITPRGSSYRVSFKWINLFRDLKTLDLAVAWRNEYLEANNMADRV